VDKKQDLSRLLPSIKR